jgi:CMP-N-acetylneuraminic acid synthetase
MKIAGIIAAKENSNRFPGKNYYSYKNKPIYRHNFDLLNENPLVNMTYIVTNSFEIKSYFKNIPLAVIERNINICEDDQPIFDVIKYAYHCLPERYHIIISILANSINHTQESITEALTKMINNPELLEIRSYGENGIENGILVLRDKAFKKHELSWYIGMVKSPGKEIHYKKDLDYV